MAETRLSSLNPDEARDFFEDRLVRIFDSDRLWLKCTKEDFKRDIGVGRGGLWIFGDSPNTDHDFRILSYKLYEPTSRLYALIQDVHTGQQYLCNVRGLELVEARANTNNTQKEITPMINNNTKIVETRTLVLGQDIANMNTDSLLGAAVAVKKAIDDLVKANDGLDSTKIGARIDEMKADLAKIKALLDA